MIKDGVAIGTLQASQLKRFPSEQYKCFMQIRRHPPTHILTGAVVRLNQYVSPHRPRIAYSQRGPAPVLGFQIKNRDFPSLSLFICFLDQLPLLCSSWSKVFDTLLILTPKSDTPCYNWSATDSETDPSNRTMRSLCDTSPPPLHHRSDTLTVK